MAAMARRSVFSLLTRTLNSPYPSILPSRLPAAASAVERLCRVASPLGSSPIRWKTTSGSGYSPIKVSSPNWSNRPPKETILLDGCDYEHWLIVMEFPENPKASEEEMVAAYVCDRWKVDDAQEEAKKKIYSVCTTTYTGFGALISEELSYKVKGLPGVLWVLPDSYLDVPNKDYGALYKQSFFVLRDVIYKLGDLFVDGKVIHRPQFRFPERQQSPRSRPRPRYDRCRETVQVERREPMQTALSPPMGHGDSRQILSNVEQNFQSSQQIVSWPKSS